MSGWDMRLSVAGVEQSAPTVAQLEDEYRERFGAALRRAQSIPSVGELEDEYWRQWRVSAVDDLAEVPMSAPLRPTYTNTRPIPHPHSSGQLICRAFRRMKTERMRINAPLSE